MRALATRTIGAARERTRRFLQPLVLVAIRRSDSEPTSGAEDLEFRSADELPADYRLVAAKVEEDPHLQPQPQPQQQNGRMSARVEAGDRFSPVPAAPKSPKNGHKEAAFTVTRSQLIAALVLSVGAVVLAALLTFTFTKQAAGFAANDSRCALSVYDDKFDIP